MKNHLIPVIKATIGIFLLLILKWIAISLPMTGKFEIYITLSISIIVSIILVNFINNYQNNIKQILPNYPEFAVIVKNLLFLAVVVILYNSIHPFAYKFIYNYIWIVQIVAVVIGFFFLAKVGLTIYNSLDKLTNLFLGTLGKKKSEESNKCPQCEGKINNGSTFCASCGFKIAV